MKKIVYLIIIALSLSAGSTALAAVPYDGYNYYSQQKYAPAPAAYLPDEYLTGNDIGSGSLNSPADLFVVGDDTMYLLDSGNNRIIILDDHFRTTRIITTVNNGSLKETMNSPSGIFVSDEGVLYVADTGNNRIIGLDEDDDIVFELKDVRSETFAEDFVFLPLKIAVDASGSIFVIAKNVFQGIMIFSSEGAFAGYVGTLRVKASPIDLFWRKFSTKAQRQKMPLFIPTEFSNLDIDGSGFVYATNIDKGSVNLIHKLNPHGTNVLRNYDEYTLPVGDMMTKAEGPFQGQSRFAAIKIRGSGIYTVVDDLRGRIFTYDNEGHLLYVFGGIGTQVGTLKTPADIEEFAGRIVVLDSGRSSMTTYVPSLYGDLINEAVSMHYTGNDDEAYKVWAEIAKMDSNNELAYVGIGKAQLAEGDNLAAMSSFRRARSKRYYSIAFKRYRNEIFQQYSPYLLTLIIVVAVVYASLRVFRKSRKRVPDAID